MPITRRLGLIGLTAAASVGTARATAAPDGQITIASHVSLAPTWFDPAETAGIITPFLLLYAIHDAVAKAMPGNQMAPVSPSPGPWRRMG